MVEAKRPLKAQLQGELAASTSESDTATITANAADQERAIENEVRRADSCRPGCQVERVLLTAMCSVACHSSTTRCSPSPWSLRLRTTSSRRPPRRAKLNQDTVKAPTAPNFDHTP